MLCGVSLNVEKELEAEMDLISCQFYEDGDALDTSHQARGHKTTSKLHGAPFSGSLLLI